MKKSDFLIKGKKVVGYIFEAYELLPFDEVYISEAKFFLDICEKHREINLDIVCQIIKSPDTILREKGVTSNMFHLRKEINGILYTAIIDKSYYNKIRYNKGYLRTCHRLDVDNVSNRDIEILKI